MNAYVCACGSKRLTTLLAARTAWHVASFLRYATMTVTLTLTVMCWKCTFKHIYTDMYVVYAYIYIYMCNNITRSFLFVCIVYRVQVVQL